MKMVQWHSKPLPEEQDISEKYLEQIINPLTKIWFGKKFSWCTRRLYTDQKKIPNDISIGEILRILEGSLAPVDCVDNPMCENSDNCVRFLYGKK